MNADFARIFSLPEPGQTIRVIAGPHMGKTLIVDGVHHARLICDVGGGDFQALDPRDVVIADNVAKAKAERAGQIYEEVRRGA